MPTDPMWCYENYREAAEYIDELEETIKDLQLAAARYNFLREQQWNTSPIAVVKYPKDNVKLGSDCPSMERLDEIIDVYMKREKDYERYSRANC